MQQTMKTNQKRAGKTTTIHYPIKHDETELGNRAGKNLKINSSLRIYVGVSHKGTLRSECRKLVPLTSKHRQTMTTTKGENKETEITGI